MFQETSGSSKSRSRSPDLQIADLRESVLVLNSQRDDHAPISRLPVEIVIEIFLLHRKNMMRKCGLQTIDWIGITHVSRLWREIALNCSGLWISIPFHKPKWAEEMIARSRHACPIVIAAYDPLEDLEGALLLRRFLQQHLSRVQVLKIDIRPHLLEQLFRDIQPTPVPYLSTLILSTKKSATGSSPVFDWLEIMDSRLLNTNSLRKVQAPTSQRWDLGLFSGLTHLVLGVHHGEIIEMPRTQASQSDFLDALRRMPTIQCLVLKGNTVPEATDGSPQLEPVHLRNLEKITVCDTSVDVVGFLFGHVIFPGNTRIIVHCKYPNPVSRFEKISSALAPLKKLLADRPTPMKFRHIKCSCFESYRTNLTHQADLVVEGYVSSECPSWNDDGQNLRPDFRFFFACNWDPNVPIDVDRLGSEFFGIFPQDDVVSIFLSSNNSIIPFKLLARKAAQFPALENISLKSISPAPFLVELNCEEDPSATNAPYPALRYVDTVPFRSIRPRV